jgi:hypothetical protein
MLVVLRQAGATQGKPRLDPIALDHLTEKRSLCFRALDRHAPDAHLLSVPGLPYFRKEGEPAISGRIEPSKPAWGRDFVKKLPGQESKTEIQLNANPSCRVLSQLPLCSPVPAVASLGEPAPQYFLGVALIATPAVDVGGVEEVDAVPHGDSAVSHQGFHHDL